HLIVPRRERRFSRAKPGRRNPRSGDLKVWEPSRPARIIPGLCLCASEVYRRGWTSRIAFPGTPSQPHESPFAVHRQLFLAGAATCVLASLLPPYPLFCNRPREGFLLFSAFPLHRANSVKMGCTPRAEGTSFGRTMLFLNRVATRRELQ